MKSAFPGAVLVLSSCLLVTNVAARGSNGFSGGGHSVSSSAPRAGAARGYSGTGPMRGSAVRGYRGMYAPARFPIYGNQPIRPAGTAPLHTASRQSSTVHRSTSGQMAAARRANQGTIASPVRGSRGGQTSRRANDQDLKTPAGTGRQRNWARNDAKNKGQFDAATQQKLRNSTGRHSDLVEARQRNGDNRRHHHGCDWWRHHCDTIILVDFGFWGWWEGWWYPAWGYDPYYSYYPYDGPVYGYDGLPPDEVVANVQSELQRRGYYSYAADGVLGPLTQNALNRYQRDHRLPITGTIDPATINSLGLSD